MHIRTLSLVAAALSLAGPAAHAQDAPPIKPGLWQMKMANEIDGQKAPDVAEMMKSVPPEMRKQMETMMKERGVDMSGGGGTQRICQDKASLDQGRWTGEQGRCKTDIVSRSASVWKWRSVCTGPDSETDGEARFAGPESYAVTARSTMRVSGQVRTTNTTITAQWVSANCGDLKPIRPPATK